MINQVANLSLYTATSMNDALNLPASIASDVFDSKVFDNWKKSRDAEAKTQGAIVDRLNDVIRALGSVAKIISGR